MLHADLGGHTGVRWFEVDDAARFFTRHFDAIDAVVPPGTGVGRIQMGYHPCALTVPRLRRRSLSERGAA